MVNIRFMTKDDNPKRDMSVFDFKTLFKGYTQPPSIVESLEILDKFKKDLIEDGILESDMTMGDVIHAVVDRARRLKDRSSSSMLDSDIFYGFNALALYINFLNTYPRFDISRDTINSGLFDNLNRWTYDCNLSDDVDLAYIGYSKIELNKKLNENAAKLDLTTTIAYIYSYLGYPVALYFIFILTNLMKEEDDN